MDRLHEARDRGEMHVVVDVLMKCCVAQEGNF